MALSAKFVRAQLARLSPILANAPLEQVRRGQEKIGELMSFGHRDSVIVRPHTFALFSGAWIIPQDERRAGVMLYLHGGGYTCGDLEYAKGVGSTLAVECGMRVFCAAYRLAPEHPFPAALEDALTAYRYLLSKGYDAKRIALCGESAGGGLVYALCLRLKELGEPLPGGIVAISPWTDLTVSGESYEYNKEKDCSLQKTLLEMYADSYTAERTDPLVSPLFGELEGLPPSLLIAGGDEILLDDARRLHEKLLAAGCKSQLLVKPERWHAYLLYGLAEDADDFNVVNRFLNREVTPERKLRWMRLDNAAKIYPAALNRNWSNVFRLSATLNEPVDAAILRSALEVTVRRFPSIAVRLRRGVFWYYLEQLPHAPALQQEQSWPLARMYRQDIRRCAFRVIVWRDRIAVEFFHAVTDGSGGMIFLKSLVAEYLQQRYGVYIPAENGVFGRLEEPCAAEMEDSFLKHAGRVSASRREATAWHLSGTPETGGFLHLTCFTLPVADVLAQARARGVSLTAYLAAAMLMALQNLQKKKVRLRLRRKPLKVLLPVNLRPLFGSWTLRNFALYTTPGIDPRLGRYSFEEILRIVHHHMGMEINAKTMASRIATNVNSERLWIVRILPLFIKNIVMKAVFDAVGECKSCLSMSNLGAVKLPETMQPYVKRMDFIIGPQARAPHNCGVLSYDGTLYINFIRNIQEPELEAHFAAVLRELGLPVQVQSNRPAEP